LRLNSLPAFIRPLKISLCHIQITQHENNTIFGEPYREAEDNLTKKNLWNSILHQYLIIKFEMKIILSYAIVFQIIWSGCKPKENKILLPDLRPNFSELLNRKDSTLSLDSFYFIRIDTINEKKALIHQRFSFLHIMENINGQLEWMANKMDSFHSAPSANDIETLEYLNSEKAYVGKEIDSLSSLIANADSIAPIGYRAFYKATVSKKDKFIVSDTIAYAISLKMIISDWDRNLEKIIDSLAIGKPFHPDENR
jgi:hypothetical protein